MGIISFDYEFVDYTKARLRSGGNGYDFELENSNIQEVYTATGNLRAGAEIRLGPISVRGGYSYFGSPYASDQLNADSDYSVYSTGIGINNNSFYFDLTYAYSTNSQNYVMYQFPEAAIAEIESNNSQVMATFGFRF